MSTGYRILGIVAMAGSLLSCQQPKPKTSVDVMRDGAVVDVRSRKSDVYVGEEGIKIDSKKTNIDIGKEGLRILSW